MSEGSGAESAPDPVSGPAPRVFISYAQESPEHREAVRDLWLFLRAHGVDAHLDRVAAQRRQDWTLWMEQQIDLADHVLVIASPAYNNGPARTPTRQWGGGCSTRPGSCATCSTNTNRT